MLSRMRIEIGRLQRAGFGESLFIPHTLLTLVVNVNSMGGRFQADGWRGDGMFEFSARKTRHAASGYSTQLGS
jgi:hypothetical protein